jgi:hypothetical protein
MNTFWIKVLMMPPVIAGVTYASKKWGNSMGGVIASLPWVGGPILLFIAIEQGVEFATGTISGIMVGIIGWLAFCITYLLIGQRFNALISVLAGYLAYILVGLLLQNVTPMLSVNTWFIITLILIIVTLKNFPKIKTETCKSGKRLHFEVPLRMLMITAFVVGITYFADLLGPVWSGILTPFPIMTAVLAIFVHYTQGIHQVRTIFLGLYNGIFGFTAFLYLQVYLLPIMSIGYAFSLGLLIDIVITFSMMWGLRKLSLA